MSLLALHYAHVKRDRTEARKTLDPYIAEHPWARLTLLRVECAFGAWEPIADAAEACLNDAPDQVHVLECARALARAKRFERAAQVARGLARDRSSPEGISKQAYDLLVRILGRELDDWPEADKAYDEWQHEFPGDPAASKWFPPLALHRTQRKATVLEG